MKSLSDWRKKASSRLASGTWTPAPWAKEAWANADHFAHVSREDKSQIAFFPSDTYGERDAPLRMKPGRYLQKYYAHLLTPEQINAFAAKVRINTFGLRFAKSSDEIERIYRGTGHGTAACMSHSRDHFPGPCSVGMHPTAIYTGTLEVSYLEKDGMQCARALVWPERKLHSRAYGDTQAITASLEQSGFTPGLLSGAPLIGASLNEYARQNFAHEISDDDHSTHFLVCPYVDHIKWARYDGKHLILQHTASGATHSVQHGNGVAYPIKLAPQRPNQSYILPAIEWATQFALEQGKPLTPEDIAKLKDEHAIGLRRIRRPEPPRGARQRFSDIINVNIQLSPPGMTFADAVMAASVPVRQPTRSFHPFEADVSRVESQICVPRRYALNPTARDATDWFGAWMRECVISDLPTQLPIPEALANFIDELHINEHSCIWTFSLVRHADGELRPRNLQISRPYSRVEGEHTFYDVIVRDPAIPQANAQT